MKNNLSKVLMITLLVCLAILVFFIGFKKVEYNLAAKLYKTNSANAQEILPQMNLSPTESCVSMVYSNTAQLTPTGMPIEYDYSFKYQGKIKGPSLFFGDSLTEGILIYGFYKDSLHMGINALTADKALLHVDELSSHKPAKLFMMIGTNDMWGGEPVDAFAEKYRLLVKNIKEKCPKTKVYIQSILPVSKSATQRNPLSNNESIDRANLKLKDIARENGLVYLDINSRFKNKEGYLYPEYTQDGIHLVYEYYHVWMDVLEKYVN